MALSALDRMATAPVLALESAPSLRMGMASLLQQAVHSTAATGDDLLFKKILSDLLPDEARIVAALSSGEVYACADVLVRTGRREPDRTVARNISTVGRMAGVAAPAHTHRYLTRLDELGLVDIGPMGGSSLTAQYELLELDPAVTKAGGKAKIVRTTVRISAFGSDFWAAVDPFQRDSAREYGSWPELG